MKAALAVLALIIAALVANTLVVDSRTRPAMARSGGRTTAIAGMMRGE
jgi:hypothetical protein